MLRCDGGGETSTRLPLKLGEGLVSRSCLWSLLEVLEVIVIDFGRLSQQFINEEDVNYLLSLTIDKDCRNKGIVTCAGGKVAMKLVFVGA